jgi:hypothetical protein
MMKPFHVGPAVVLALLAGDLRYRFFFDGQKTLLGYLPPEPRMFDVMWRTSFTELPMPEQDGYDPQGWAVSIVSDSIDHPARRQAGGRRQGRQLLGAEIRPGPGPRR